MNGYTGTVFLKKHNSFAMYKFDLNMFTCHQIQLQASYMSQLHFMKRERAAGMCELLVRCSC